MTYHFMWLFDSKLHETFPVITIDRGWCETHETSFINIAQIYIYIFWKGLSCKQGVLSKFKLSSISYIWLWLLQHHLICHVWAQTHCLTGDKHLGCYISDTMLLDPHVRQWHHAGVVVTSRGTHMSVATQPRWRHADVTMTSAADVSCPGPTRQWP